MTKTATAPPAGAVGEDDPVDETVGGTGDEAPSLRTRIDAHLAPVLVPIQRLRDRGTARWRIPGAVLFGGVVGVLGGLAAPGAALPRAIAGAIVSLLAGCSLYAYWAFAGRLGRWTSLAGLSLLWGTLLAGMSLALPGDQRTVANTTAWALSGVMLVWMAALLVLPAAWLARRPGRRRQRRAARAERAEARAQATAVARSPHRGRYTPKASQQSRDRAARH